MTAPLTVSLDVAGRPAVVVGGGPEAVTRVRALRHGDAEVTVITPAPAPRIVALADAGEVGLHRRGYRDGDLAGVFVAYVTREDPTPVAAAWAEAERERVLLSTLDDVERCHFATPAVVRRGDVAITVATAGRAPALAKRVRRELEEVFGPELGDLVDVLADARGAGRPASVPFREWAARWERALDDLDGALEAVRTGRGEQLRAHVERTLRVPSGEVA